MKESWFMTSVEKELKNTLHNLRIDLEQTTATINIINECLTSQIQKRRIIRREISVAKDLLNVIQQEKKSPYPNR